LAIHLHRPIGQDHAWAGHRPLKKIVEKCLPPGYVPEEWELEGPAVSISLGDAADLDPALLAAISGPEGMGGNALCAAYEQDAAADVLRPGPVLAALTEQAANEVGRLTDDQLMGALSAARRLARIYPAGYLGVTHSGRAIGPTFFSFGAVATALAWLRAARKRCWAPCFVSP
jgi:hypothetical protein